MPIGLCPVCSRRKAIIYAIAKSAVALAVLSVAAYLLMARFGASLISMSVLFFVATVMMVCFRYLDDAIGHRMDQRVISKPANRVNAQSK